MAGSSAMSDEDCVPGKIDPLELAWAAGFFDGEGTTMARSTSDRPGYRQLNLTVPQS